MGDFLKSRLGKILVTALVAAGLAIACEKFPKSASILAPLAMAVAAAMPSALAKYDDEVQP